MSGYDPLTGIYELSWDKAYRYAHHRTGGECPGDIERVIEELIEKSNHHILGRSQYGFKLVANDAQIWELLSGKSATSGFTDEEPSVVYRRWLETREWFNATEIGRELPVVIGPAKVNKILVRLGYIQPESGGWIPTEFAQAEQVVKVRDTSSSFGNKPCVFLHRKLIDILTEWVE